MYTIEFKWGYRTSVPITASPLLPPGFQGHHWAPTRGAREVGGGKNFKGTPGLNHPPITTAKWFWEATGNHLVPNVTIDTFLPWELETFACMGA